MKYCVVINTFNYAIFIKDAIESVLKQTKYELIENIIIVNDGSTDNTTEILKLFDNDKITIINKANGGQLSAFNEAFNYCKGDIVTFLDADDIYKNNYIEEINNIYINEEDIDFISVKRQFFGKDTGMENFRYLGDYGYSAFETKFNYSWIGTSTSGISIKRNILKKILPLKEIEDDWITRADDCIVFGASLVGAKKYFLDKTLIKYRIHDRNYFYNRQFSKSYYYRRQMAIEKLFNIIIEKNKISFTPRLFLNEILSKKNKKYFFKTYREIIFKTDWSLYTKLNTLIKLYKRKIK